jgi:hypothetical protein
VLVGMVRRLDEDMQALHRLEERRDGEGDAVGARRIEPKADRDWSLSPSPEAR